MTQHELKQRINLERRIVRTIVNDALLAGFSLNVDNGGDSFELADASTDKALLLRTLFQTDEERIYVYNPSNSACIGWIRLVYGNDGWDVVNDYTVNLEPIMRNADKLAEKYS
jgi:hypothetical protein